MPDSTLDQLVRMLQDLGVWCQEHSLELFIGLPVMTMLIVWLQSRWEHREERQQAYHPIFLDDVFGPENIDFTASKPVRREASRKPMMGAHSVYTFLTGKKLQ